jgi:WD40 repeat protein
VLCIDWKGDGTIIFAGCGLDNSVKCIDVNTGSIVTLTQHNAPVFNIFWIEKL